VHEGGHFQCHRSYVDDRCWRQHFGKRRWPTLDKSGLNLHCECPFRGWRYRSDPGQHGAFKHAAGRITDLFLHSIEPELRNLGRHWRLRHTSLANGIKIKCANDQFMAMNDSSSDQASRAEQKKPYEKPSFRCEQVFVTTALRCLKTGTTGSCQHGSKKVS